MVTEQPPPYTEYHHPGLLTATSCAVDLIPPPPPPPAVQNTHSLRVNQVNLTHGGESSTSPSLSWSVTVLSCAFTNIYSVSSLGLRVCFWVVISWVCADCIILCSNRERERKREHSNSAHRALSISIYISVLTNQTGSIWSSYHEVTSSPRRC